MTILHDNAHAKINLYLHVTGRRDDGYHLLDSLAVFSEAADHISLEETTKETSLSIHGPFGQNLQADENNLILRAIKLLRHHTNETDHYAIKLQKNLPIASGIGGGSADAACTLRLLTQKWHQSEEKLLYIAQELGADVPVCLKQNPTRMEGIGEILTSAPSMPLGGILLVNPKVAVSTPSVFKRFSEMGGPPHHLPIDYPNRWNSMTDLKEFLLNTSNDLQAPAIQIAPVIGNVINIIAKQKDCLLARMSGSGATCFGLFPSPEAAQKAAHAITSDSTSMNWWTWAGNFFHNDI